MSAAGRPASIAVASYPEYDPHAADHAAERDMQILQEIVTAARNLRADLALFAEAPSRVVVTVHPDHLGTLDHLLSDLPHTTLGRVTGGVLRVTMGESELLSVAVSDLERAYESLPSRLD